MRRTAPLSLLLGLYVVLAILYSLNTPLFEAPDEYYHFAVIDYLARTGDFPPREAPQAFPWRQMAFHAPLYYRLGAFLIAPVNTNDFLTHYPLNPHAQIGEPDAPDNVNFVAHTGDPLQDTGLAVRLVRGLSIVLGAITLTGVYRIARLTVPASPVVALVAVCVVIFNPQFLYLSGVISNDNLVVALVTLSLALLIQLIRQGIDWPRLVVLAMLMACASIAKSSGIALYPVVMVALIWVCWRDRAPTWKMVAYGIVGLSIWAVIAGGWYIENWRTLGDPTASRAVAEATGFRSGEIDVIGELRGVYYSFWGLFGWFNVRAPAHFYTWVSALIIFALVGVGVRFARMRTLHTREDSAITFVLGGFVVVFFASWWQFNQWVLAGQGRLWFPLLALFALILALGLTAPYLRLIAPVLIGGMAIFALIFPFSLLHPAYAPRPQIALADWQENAQLASVRFREPWQEDACLNLWIGSHEIRIEGDVLSVPMMWGAHCEVSGYWSVFAHLSDLSRETCIVGDTSHILIQRDTMPSGGNMPFPALKNGSVMADELHITLPADFVLTTSTRLQLGLYDAGGSFIRAFVEPEQSRFADGVELGNCSPELVNITLTMP